MPKLSEHFDRQALVDAVHAQPIGLVISTNHPEGFRRLMYLYLRQHQDRKLHILQSPASANSFFLVKEGFTLSEAA